MEPEEKIYKVLDRIYKESKISPDPKLIEFIFNRAIGGGMVSGQDERKILLKLEKENIIKLQSPDIYQKYTILKEHDINSRKSVKLKMLDEFEKAYEKYKPALKNINNSKIENMTMSSIIKKYKFKEFDFQKFLEFDRELVDVHHLGEVRFYPKQGMDLFNKPQLEHTAPNWDINHPKGFLYVWSRNKNTVRMIVFEQFNKSGTPKIKMTVNLDKKTISLDEAQSITAEKIEESLEKFIPIKYIINDANGVNKWWKYTHPIWWIWFLVLFLFRDTIWQILKQIWNFEWVQWLVANMAVPLIIIVVGGIIVAYIVYKFNWNG